jgi:hypothetical protein
MARIRIIVRLAQPAAGSPSPADLRHEIADLRRQRRSSAGFRDWTPGIFYYLYALVVAVLLASLTTGVGLGVRTVAVALLSFTLLSSLPPTLNRLRLWYTCRRPNRQLDRRILSLQSRVNQLDPRP